MRLSPMDSTETRRDFRRKALRTSTAYRNCPASLAGEIPLFS